MAEAAVAAPAESKEQEAQGLGSATTAGEAAKRDEEEQLGGKGKAEQDSAPASQPSSEPALTCAGLDTGIVIEELISNEAEAKAGEEAEVQVPMGKNSIEVQEPAGNEQQPAPGARITTTAGENEAVVVLAGADAAGEAGQSEKAPKSCVVNMANLDEEQKGKKAAGKKETPAKTNGSARANKKTAEAATKPAAEPKKRGRKPGSGKKQNSPPKLDLTAQPFTPAQQMQLRAQILVYGALIQSTLPDESLMSASYFDAAKVRGTENYESYYSAAKSTWDKTWKAAYDRIKKATGQAPKLVSFAAAHVPPGIRSPAAPGNFATPGLPPKPAAAKAGGKTNSSTPPTGPETGYSSMASATVASWSARNRAPDPNSWNLYPGAPPPRFPFPQGSPAPASAMGPWGTAATTGYFSPTTFPATPPAFAQPVPLAAASADGGEPQAKRRKVAAGTNNGTTQLEDADKLEESVRAVELARRTAEEMATASDSVVQQSHRVWKEMKEKVTSNSATAKEAQVAACMAAITAASSVARAASAAANVAYAAAMQAKAMAVEAAKARDEDPTVTQVMQGEDQFIAGVKQAARSQAKSAFLIAQQAENIGAIVRAAEMASEAARQASSIMAIGNPAAEKSPKAKKNSNNNSNNRKNSVRGGRTPVGRGKKNDGGEQPKGEKSSELANTNTNDAVMEDAEQQQQQQQNAEPAEGMVEDRQQFKPTDIKEGSHVEIKPGEEEGLSGVWFSAKVLEIKEDKALVVYDDLLDEDGQGDHLKEWVDLTSHLDNVPRVRIAHPMTAEASLKKKRRAAMGNQIWLKGDHVDVWMRDGWWEGIVKSAEDEKVTVFFPADGDSDVTKSWNMRPSLIWHEGSWIPWRETRKEKMEAGSSQDDSVDMETPKLRSGAKPTKRKKFSDVMEKEHEQRKRLLEEQAKLTPKSGSKRKKPSSDRKRSTSSEVTSDGEADVKKSSKPSISKVTLGASSFQDVDSLDTEHPKRSGQEAW